MPHLTIEYTANLSDFDPTAALLAANEALIKSNLFSEPDIKSRAICRDHFLIGAGSKNRAYVHARLEMLSGRSSEQRISIAQAVMRALIPLRENKGAEIQLSVETVEIHAASYAKVCI